MNITAWTILGILAIASITVFYKKNTIWGAVFLGIVVGMIIGFVYLIQGNKFAWDMILKGGIIGALAGAISEWLRVWLKQRRN